MFRKNISLPLAPLSHRNYVFLVKPKPGLFCGRLRKLSRASAMDIPLHDPNGSFQTCVDYKARPLRPTEWALTLGATVLSTYTMWTFIQPGTIIPAITGIVICLLTYSFLKERQFKQRELSPQQLLTVPGFIDPSSSRLLDISLESSMEESYASAPVGRRMTLLSVHYTIHKSAASSPSSSLSSSPPLHCHCYHGFGAWSVSWASSVASLLSARLAATVTAHCTPGFGLTQRPRDLSCFTTEFNARLGESIIAEEMEQQQQGEEGEEENVGLLLAGHSMGALSVAEHVLLNPSKVRGIILVAPAILAQSKQQQQQEGEKKEKVPSLPWRLCRRMVSVFHGFLLWFFSSVFSLSYPVLLPFLRRMVRNREFWARGLRSAWTWKSDKTNKKRRRRETNHPRRMPYPQEEEEEEEDNKKNKNKVELLQFYVDEYRKPQTVKGWDWGMLDFVRSRLSMGGGGLLPFATIVRAMRAAHRPSLLCRLIEAVKEHRIPVLIIHGKKDRLVPLSNSQKLQEALPQGSCVLVEMDDTGHVPHEEESEMFVELVQQWWHTERERANNSSKGGGK